VAKSDRQVVLPFSPSASSEISRRQPSGECALRVLWPEVFDFTERIQMTIYDEFSYAPVSRQRKYQMRRQAQRRCTLCGAPAFTKLYCVEHAIGVRERKRRKEKAKKRYYNAFTYKAGLSAILLGKDLRKGNGGHRQLSLERTKSAAAKNAGVTKRPSRADNASPTGIPASLLKGERLETGTIPLAWRNAPKAGSLAVALAVR
jgi:hypothetical protein